MNAATMYGLQPDSPMVPNAPLQPNAPIQSPPMAASPATSPVASPAPSPASTAFGGGFTGVAAGGGSAQPPTPAPMGGGPPKADFASKLYGIGSSAPAGPGIGQNSYGIHPDVSKEQIANFLMPSIGNVESNNSYTSDRALTHKGQTASGRYQYIDSTWNNYGGYKRAVDAPPEIQDQRMKEDLSQRLDKYNNDPFKVTAAHYVGEHNPYVNDPSKWDQPLVDSHGKKVQGAATIKDYLQRVFTPQRVNEYLSQQQPDNAASG